jgi:putative zinc finger/helix-turn-helix YgiT family protein
MNENHCAKCGKGEIEFRKTQNFETMVRGVPFTVPEATIGYCTTCGAKVFDPKEIRRWQKLYEADHVSKGKLLSATDVANIRRALGLQINQFALLVGTTRQSVYNWERENRNSPQLRIVDVLLRLIRESIESGAVDVVKFLRDQAGLDQTEQESNSLCRTRSRFRRGIVAARRRKSSEFDRIFGQSGNVRELPRLSRY